MLWNKMENLENELIELKQLLFATRKEIDYLNSAIKQFSIVNRRAEHAIIKIESIISPKTKITVEKIFEEDAILIAYEMIEKYNLQTKSRHRDFVMPRQYLMYFMHTNCNMTFEKIGELFNRHHATVIHSIRNCEQSIEIGDEIFARYISELKIDLNLRISKLAKQTDEAYKNFLKK